MNFEYFLRDDAERFRKRENKLDLVFAVIVLISMCLCFFSLTSSMSANIFDQSKEITIMRSCGMTKRFILRIYVYESLILILSCSLCGFGIGISIGNLMVLQQSTLQAIPFTLAAPVRQLLAVLATAIVLAVGSTWRAARTLLNKSIPDIQRFVN